MNVEDTPSNIEILKSESLTTVVRAEIESMVMRGELRMGDRVNEVALAVRFGVSRGPIREACRALAEKGLLTNIRNRGAFVRVISLDEARKLYEVRAGIFGYAGYLVASRPVPGTLKRLRELADSMIALAEKNRTEEYYPLNLAFHDTILEATENDYLISFYKDLVAKLHLFRSRGLVQPGSITQSAREHDQIVKAIATGEPTLAFTAAHDHVTSGLRRMLFAMDD